MRLGWSKAPPERRCICSLRQRPDALMCRSNTCIYLRTLSARDWLLWKALSDRHTCREKVTGQSIGRKTRTPPTTTATNLLFPICNNPLRERLFSMLSKYDVTRKWAAQVCGVHYHIFNWLVMSPTWGMCHEMLNKTWLAEEESSHGRKAQL